MARVGVVCGVAHIDRNLPVRPVAILSGIADEAIKPHIERTFGDAIAEHSERAGYQCLSHHPFAAGKVVAARQLPAALLLFGVVVTVERRFA